MEITDLVIDWVQHGVEIDRLALVGVDGAVDVSLILKLHCMELHDWFYSVDGYCNEDDPRDDRL